MKVSRIVINGFIIYIGIALFFVIMEALGLSDQIYLRLVNFVFVIYGVNRTIKQDYNDGTYGYFTNLGSAFLTAFTSLVLTLVSFLIYVEVQGGEAYLDRYVASYIFVGDPSLPQFVMGLMIEGLAASAIVSFALMQWWKDKVEKINQVDDADHTNQNT